MTSYALSLTVVVVDLRRLALVCNKNGGKQAGKPAGQEHYWEMNVKKTTSLKAVTDSGRKCPWRLVYFKNPKLFAATNRQLEM